MKSRIAVVAIALLVASCATPPPPPAPPDETALEASAAPLPPPPAPASDNPTESLPLEVVMTDQTTTGRVMKLRAKVINPHAETVEGVRVQLVFLAPGEDEMKVLEVQQKELGSTLKPGDSTMLHWDVESLYLGTGVGRFALVAYPKRLGGKDLPPPDNWQE